MCEESTGCEDTNMKNKKVSNPLSKRVFRELWGDWRKYLVLFLLLVITIGFVSGMYVANNSMLKAEEDGVTGYKMEYGHFEINEKADDALLEKLSSGDKADVWAWAADVARKEADQEIAKKALEEAENQAELMLRQAMGDTYASLSEDIKNEKKTEILNKILDSEEYKNSVEEFRKEAYAKIDEEIEKKKNEEDLKKSESEKKQEAEFFAVPIEIHELFFKNLDEDVDKDGKKEAKIRVYTMSEDIDLACLMEGEFPKADNEVAIDRMHASNNSIKVGDTIRLMGQDFKVSGLIAMVNYSALYESNTDAMFDALNFNVGYVTQKAFDSFNVSTHYNYAWFYNDKKLGDKAIDHSASKEEQEKQEKILSDNLMVSLVTQCTVAENELVDYVPRYNNSAINFAKDDLSGDEVMVGILLYILILMIAFIFGVTISSTITKEASAIGTLRASGYTKSELVRHYISVPVLVTLIASIIGNVLGYTLFKFIVVDMYYNSYSLPTYVTVWNYQAFVRTTVVPVIIMIIVTWIIVRRSMRFSPLKFLRHDLRTSKRKKAVRLPKISFFRRFRLRVVLQNIYNYIVLFFGLAFVMILMAFSFGLPSTLNNYTDKVSEQIFCKNQYILKTTEDADGNVITTATPGAEKYCVSELVTTDGVREGESISIYGVEEESAYLSIPKGLNDGEVYISSAYRDKFRLKEGESITLKDRFASDSYTFKIAGILDYTGGLITVMPKENFNQTFGLRADYFSGYLSDEEIKDIEPENIAASVSEEDILKISRQLNHSMGDYMKLFQVVCFILALILIYMLTKVIIEKNENAISMVKILGYENKEIASLYLISTTWFVLISAVITAFLGVWALSKIWIAYMGSMDGWLPVHFGAMDYLAVIGITFGAYLVVMLFDFRRIKRVPMDEALKNVE